MENLILYTFSTIPQTIAAALGVLAAFVLYRLQSGRETQSADARDLLTEFGGDARALTPGPDTTLGQLLGAQDYERLVPEFEAQYAKLGTKDPGVDKRLALARLKASVAARRMIIAALTQAFRVTAVVILASVLILMLAHQIQASPVISWLVQSLGLVALALCLRLYWRVIRASLGIK